MRTITPPASTGIFWEKPESICAAGECATAVFLCLSRRFHGVDCVVFSFRSLTKALIAAAGGGSLELLQWLRATYCDWDWETTKTAAEGGHLAVLQWAREAGCEWDEDTCVGAARGGHVEVLQVRFPSFPLPWSTRPSKTAGTRVAYRRRRRRRRCCCRTITAAAVMCCCRCCRCRLRSCCGDASTSTMINSSCSPQS